MAKDGFDGLGKMRKGEKPAYEPKPHEGKKADAMEGGHAGEESTTIEHHADGTHSVDGQHFPNHLHAMAHLGHKITGGDKHHIVHHDGMTAHSHSIHEDGQHEDHGEEDAHRALKKFLGEEGGDGMQPEPDGQENESPVMGGM